MLGERERLSRNSCRDFRGGPVVKNPPSDAGDVGLIPGQGNKIPHAKGQLCLYAATTEPSSSRACALQQRSPQATTNSPYIYI